MRVECDEEFYEKERTNQHRIEIVQKKVGCEDVATLPNVKRIEQEERR